MSEASRRSSSDAEDAFVLAVQRVKADFLGMPGLSLTLPQAARLWALDMAFCGAVLGALTETQGLIRARASVLAEVE